MYGINHLLFIIKLYCTGVCAVKKKKKTLISTFYYIYYYIIIIVYLYKFFAVKVYVVSEPFYL